MKATGKNHVNVSCGTVNFEGKITSGCGVKPIANGYAEYSYAVPGYKSLWSTVNLCAKCASEIEG